MPATVGGDVGEGVDIDSAVEVVEAVESFDTAVSVVDVIVDWVRRVIQGCFSGSWP
jgi:hypothetical protein